VFRSKLPLSDAELERIKALAESLRELKGSQTANRVADLSDSALQLILAATRQRGRRRAIRSMWEVEDWLSGR
jgi:hypothetical protein